MPSFSNLKVSTKLISGFLIVSAIGALIGLEGILKASQMNDMATLMFERDTLGLRHASEANTQLLAVGRGVRTALLARTEEERKKQIEQVYKDLAEMTAELSMRPAKSS